VLYRTCEFLGNYRELSPEIAEKTFSKVIDVVAEIAIGVSKVDKTIDSSASPNTNKINTQVQDQYKNINQQQSNKPISPSGESNPSKDSGYDPYGDSK
jgi:asparagine synthetase A